MRHLAPSHLKSPDQAPGDRCWRRDGTTACTKGRQQWCTGQCWALKGVDQRSLMWICAVACTVTESYVKRVGVSAACSPQLHSRQHPSKHT